MVVRDKRRSDRIYRQALKHKKDGHAVYPALLADDFKPGVCGYFDRDGDWVQIVDLGIGDEELAEDGYTRLGRTLTASDPTGGTKEYFGPRVSSTMEKVEASVKAGAKSEAVSTQACVTYKSSTNKGAVLLTQGPISRSHTDVKTTVFLRWMEDNAIKIVQEHPESKEQGLWIILKTCSAEGRALSVVESVGRELSWSIDLKVTGGAKLSPAAGWWKSHDSSEWMESYNDKGVVLFYLGIEWVPTRIPWHNKRLKPILDKEKQKYLGSDVAMKDIEVVEGTEDVGELTRFTPRMVFLDED